MRKLFLLLMGVALFATQAMAQRTVTGTVTDENGKPIPNVSILVKGTSVGVTTKTDGTYSLVVPANGKALIFSSVDMTTEEINIGSQSVINSSLRLEDKTLSEVVVTGYGTQKKKDITAGIATVKFDKLKDIPAQSFDQLLSGKATGLNVSIPNGVLNNPPVIRIRGANSITGSTFPLVVVDGIPIFTGDISTNLAANNVLGNINPADIEDIQVLKDAAATAIYGSRAANGVLLITTKKGRNGKARVVYDTWVGWTKPFNLYDVLDAQEYVTLKNEAVKNLPGPVFSGHVPGTPVFFMDTINGVPVNTNWNDEAYQTGFQQNHTISVSGGSAMTKYYMSANYSKQEGMIQTNTFDRKQIRMNLEQKANNWLKLGGNFNFSRGNTASPSTGSIPGTPFATGGLARLAFVTAPNVSVYAPDGRYNIVGIDNPTTRNTINQVGRNKNLERTGFYNLAMIRDLNTITSQSDQILADVNAEIKFAKGLTFRTQYGVNWQSVDDKTFYNSLHGDGVQQPSTTADDGVAFNITGSYTTRTFQNYMTYDGQISKNHNLNFVVGSEEIKTKIDRWGASRSGLSDQFFNEFQGNFTINDNPVGNLITENYLLSFFGRANYNFKNKYFVSINGRRDGYSAFADGKKWGNFFGGSLGWNVSGEKFWQGGIAKVVNSLKLRSSFGQVGNISGVGNFASLSTFGSFQYGLGYPTIFFSQAGNKDLQWESSTKFDLGLQFGLFNDRITGELNYYKTDIEELIIAVPLPPSMGVPGNSISANAAKMYNKGIELNLTGKVIQGKSFTWDINWNFTTQKNRVTALAPGVPEIVGTTQLERTNITRVGSPLGSFFTVRSGGVDAASGRRIFLDAAGKQVFFNFADPVASRWKYADGSIAPPIDLGKDGIISGNALPTVYGGLTNTFNYNGIDLTIDAIYSYGNKVYFGSQAGLRDQRFWNNETGILRRWQKPGDVTDVPRVVFNDNISNGSSFPIDANLYDGGFIKFRSIGMGYTLPKRIVETLNMSNIRFYMQMLNPFLITNYPGIDPEISVNGNSALTPGVDRNTVGQARTITVGLNVTF